MPIPNTLALPAFAVMGCRADSVDDVKAALQVASSEDLPFIALGAGSNIIPQANVEQFVAVIALRGITVVEENAERVRLQVAAGENWHALVQHCVRQGWFGLENLALIPGSVGAAPVQNIGAYGVEVARFIESVDVLDANGAPRTIDAAHCAFSYRDSMFKTDPDLTIVRVNLCLSRQADVVVEYPELRDELTSSGVEQPTPAEVNAAVIAIRQRKLPDPDQVPNAGSFFKNPMVDPVHARTLREKYPQLHVFEQAGQAKLSAAQLIDIAGWKERQGAGVACWHRQPLVLINSGHGSTADLMEFAEAIRRDVRARFDVQLELEPSLLS